jgi:hypothetical protein
MVSVADPLRSSGPQIMTHYGLMTKDYQKTDPTSRQRGQTLA